MRRFEYRAIFSAIVVAFACADGWVYDALGEQPHDPNKVPWRLPNSGTGSHSDPETVPVAGRLITNSIGMRLVFIPPGEFEMGSSKEFIDRELGCPAAALLGDIKYAGAIKGEAPRHKVRISKPYWLGATEVTQQEYQRLMGANPSHDVGGPSSPADGLSWHDAVEFCRKLSELPEERAARRYYQLPTEAQWEYACRAGNPGAWCFSRHQGALAAPEDIKLLGEYAWFSMNSGWTTHAVGQKKPNAWGLYDMYGNVSEWCQDYYADYTSSPQADPVGPSKDDPRVVRGARVVRGGSVYQNDNWCQSALRDLGKPEVRREGTGLRVAAVVSGTPMTQSSGDKGDPGKK